MTDEIQETEEKDELETYFEGQETTEVETEVEEEPETEDNPETEETETEVESETTTDKENKSVPLAALLDERGKAQKYKEELEKLREQIPTKDEEPDIYEDPEGWKEWNRNKILSEQRAEIENERSTRINQSRSKMLETHEDYAVLEKVFELMSVEDPSLVNEMLNHPDPASFAYEKAKAYKAEVLKSLSGETEETETESQKRNKTATQMPNLATATAKGRTIPDVEKEEDIEDVFADQTY